MNEELLKLWIEFNEIHRKNYMKYLKQSSIWRGTLEFRLKNDEDLYEFSQFLYNKLKGVKE